MFFSGICEEAAFEKGPNVTPAKKKQGATPSRKRQRGIESSSSLESSADDTESNASTIILERSPQASSSPEGEQLDGKSTYWDCVLVLKLLLVLTRGDALI